MKTSIALKHPLKEEELCVNSTFSPMKMTTVAGVVKGIAQKPFPGLLVQIAPGLGLQLPCIVCESLPTTPKHPTSCKLEYYNELPRQVLRAKSEAT